MGTIKTIPCAYKKSPFIDSTNGYAGCPTPTAKLDAAVFGGVAGGAVCVGLGWAAHKAYKLHKSQESRQPLISASSSASSATATAAAPAATAAPQPRKSWCPSFSFSAGRKAPAPAVAPGYNALAESDAPSADRVLPMEVESDQRRSIQ